MSFYEPNRALISSRCGVMIFLLGLLLIIINIASHEPIRPHGPEIKLLLLAFEGFPLLMFGLYLAHTIPIVVGAILATRSCNLAIRPSSLVLDGLIVGVTAVFWGVVWVQQAYHTAVEVSPAANIVLPLVFLALLPYVILQPLAFAVVAGQVEEESSDRGQRYD